MSKRFIMFLLSFLIAAVPLLASDWLEDIIINGFISQGYLKSNYNNYLARTEDGTFEFNEFGLVVQSKISNRLSMGAQLFSRDLGYEGNNDIVLDWAYGDYHFSDAFGIRIGKLKMPYGFYNQIRDVDFLRPTILLPLSTYAEDMRAVVGSYVGTNLYGTFKLGAMGRFDYELGYGALNIDADSPFIKSLYDTVSASIPGNPEIYDRSTHAKYVYGGYLRWSTPIPGLRLGMNAGWTTIDYAGYADIPNVGKARILFDHEYIYNYIYSMEFMIGNLNITGEYHTIKTNYNITVLGQTSTIPIDPYGYYGQISYRLADWLELSSYYSEFFKDKNDEEGQRYIDQGLPAFFAWQKDLCFTARFDLTLNWILKLEFHKMSGAAFVHSFDNPDGIEEDFNLFAAKATFNF